jgi:hypothetical protein
MEFFLAAAIASLTSGMKTTKNGNPHKARKIKNLIFSKKYDIINISKKQNKKHFKERKRYL